MFGIIIGGISIAGIVCWIILVIHVTQLLIDKWEDWNHEKTSH